MNNEQREDFIVGMHKSLVEKKNIVLKVEVQSEKGAEFLLKWLYDKKTEIDGLELKSVLWDQLIICNDEIDKLIKRLEELKS